MTETSLPKTNAQHSSKKNAQASRIYGSPVYSFATQKQYSHKTVYEHRDANGIATLKKAIFEKLGNFAIKTP